MIDSLAWFMYRHLRQTVYEYFDSSGRTLLTWLHSVRNCVLGRSFYCKALTGESKYNICINSDMTVSCNCSDIDGRGRIGNLSTHSLKEIFDGTVAAEFRAKLAKGSIPIPRCLKCPELTPTDKGAAAVRLKNYSLPQGILVENTVLCNLRCLYCNRDRIMASRQKKSLTLDDLRRVALTLKDYSIGELYYFNLGEPFLSSAIHEELGIIRKYAPKVYITTSTNGVFLDNDRKREAALLMDKIFFSLDGPSQEKVIHYQVGGDFAKSYANMKQLVVFRDTRDKEKPVVEWKYVVFAWNDLEEDILEAVKLAKEACVDTISFWYGQGPAHFQSKRFYTAPYFLSLPMINGYYYMLQLKRDNPVSNLST